MDAFDDFGRGLGLAFIALMIGKLNGRRMLVLRFIAVGGLLIGESEWDV